MNEKHIRSRSFLFDSNEPTYCLTIVASWMLKKDGEKPSRLNQRSLGVTNRIWLILALFVFLLTFTHYIVPVAETPVYAFSNLNLTPRNYFNASEVGPSSLIILDLGL